MSPSSLLHVQALGLRAQSARRLTPFMVALALTTALIACGEDEAMSDGVDAFESGPNDASADASLDAGPHGSPDGAPDAGRRIAWMARGMLPRDH